MEFPLLNILLFGVSGGEIFIILLFVLLLFGPKKIPEIARAIGKGISEMKKVQRDLNTEINKYTSEIERPVRSVGSDIDDFAKQNSDFGFEANLPYGDLNAPEPTWEEPKDLNDAPELTRNDSKASNDESETEIGQSQFDPDEELPFSHNQKDSPEAQTSDEPLDSKVP